MMHGAMARNHSALSPACVAQPSDMLDTMICSLPMSASLSSCDGMQDAQSFSLEEPKQLPYAELTRLWWQHME